MPNTTEGEQRRDRLAARHKAIKQVKQGLRPSPVLVGGVHSLGLVGRHRGCRIPFLNSFAVMHRSSSMPASRLFQCCLRYFSSSNIVSTHHNLHKHKNGFGIVAAMTSNQVIGVNGSLPWKNLKQDRNHFVNLTRNKVLIVGRRTFGIEDPSLAHIQHCRACIVVSQSINQDDLIAARVDSGSEHQVPELLLARSFEEALELARLEKRHWIEQPNKSNENEDHETIYCWVAGGEAIYKEALQHPDAMEVQLTHVDMTVDTNNFRDVAFFPLEDMNANGFDEVVSTEIIGHCEFKVYLRRKI